MSDIDLVFTSRNATTEQQIMTANKAHHKQCNVINRAHSFLEVVEFRAKLQILLFSVEF